MEEGNVTLIIGARLDPPMSVTDSLTTATLSVHKGLATQELSVTPLGFPGELRDGDSAPAQVRITNTSPFRVNNVYLAAVNSEDITLSLDPSGHTRFAACATKPAPPRYKAIACVKHLEPSETQVVPLRVDVASSIRTGTEKVSVVVDGDLETRSGAVTTTSVTSSDVKLTILGLDVLSPFGISVLFVLPGLVALGLFLALTRFVYPRSTATPDTVDFKDPRVLVFVVVPAFVAYVVVSSVKRVGLNQHAGTRDVIDLFAVGLLLGLFAWGVLAVVYYVRSGRKQFTVGDSASKVLQRLNARGGRLTLPVVTVGELQYRLLTFANDAGKAVVCPAIRFAFPDGASEPARRRLYSAIDDDDPGRAIDAATAASVSLSFEFASGVMTVDKPTITATELSVLVEGQLQPRSP
jgi:hypothetical protein